MKILLTGVSGYIGARLLQKLSQEGHHLTLLARDRSRLKLPHNSSIDVIECDLLQEETLHTLPRDIDCAYYLVHSMQKPGFEHLEQIQVANFLKAVHTKQIVYLTGLICSDTLSPHLSSRLHVEEAIKASGIPYTVFRAGIVIGSGSASFEIIRDLAEKLPVMIAPRWVKSLCQPISVHDVITYLERAAGNAECSNQVFDIGGPDVLTYKDMLLGYAKVRGLKRYIITVPVLTPRLSSYWLLLITSTNFLLAKALVESLKSNAICTNRHIDDVLPHTCLNYEESLKRAFSRIEQSAVISSWTDSMVSSDLSPHMMQYVKVPKFGAYRDEIDLPLTHDRKDVIDRLWQIGGHRGWYAYDFLWKIRGAIDKLFGGVGLRRGRRDAHNLRSGDALDFWRVLLADKEEGHLLLYAEMKLPGEAWLEFTVTHETFRQRAVFRPKGLLGRLYWYSVLPFHHFLFRKMATTISLYSKSQHRGE